MSLQKTFKATKSLDALISDGNELKIWHIALKQLLSPYVFNVDVLLYVADVRRGAEHDLVSLMLESSDMSLKYCGA